LQKIKPESAERALSAVLYYLYFNYDLHEPFFEQYERNCALVMALLKHKQ